MTSQFQSPLAKGSVLEQYEIIQVLGKGGFGITYLALNTRLSETVVIKEYFPDVLAAREFNTSEVSVLSEDKRPDFADGLKRFEREANTLAEFNHPNIVKVLTLFHANNTAYFTMRHINGRSLKAFQQGQELSPKQLKDHCLPILEGLAAIHDAGLLHLDIKPDNILLPSGGEAPMLIDFGGARVDASKQSHELSRHTSMVASDGFAPPEQYSTIAEQTPATDIYAFGMTLYALMAPKVNLPKSSDRQQQVFADLPDPLPPIRSVAKGFDEALYQTVEQCTQLKQNARPQSVEEVRQTLGTAATTASDYSSRQATSRFNAQRQEAERYKPEGIETRLAQPQKTTGYIKISATGEHLPDSARSWAGVLDRVTGLMWEVKTNDGGIHDKDNDIYRWGGKGVSNTALGQYLGNNECEAIRWDDEGEYYDDWNTLVDGSNREQLCGKNDWRVPTLYELASLVHCSCGGYDLDDGCTGVMITKARPSTQSFSQIRRRVGFGRPRPMRIYNSLYAWISQLLASAMVATPTSTTQ